MTVTFVCRHFTAFSGIFLYCLTCRLDMIRHLIHVRDDKLLLSAVCLLRVLFELILRFGFPRKFEYASHDGRFTDKKFAKVSDSLNKLVISRSIADVTENFFYAFYSSANGKLFKSILTAFFGLKLLHKQMLMNEDEKIKVKVMV